MLDAQILLTHATGYERTHIVAWPEKDLDNEQQKSFMDLVRRRATGTPIAHITGRREFWSLDFETDDSTLIPRPETETLVEFILSKFADKPHRDLLDMGTGTGAIAIALATEKPQWSITGSDISQAAIELAMRNSARHDTVNTRFIHSDWFQRFDAQRFDIIISNPPYIAEDDPHLMQGDLRFEPRTALTSGTDGMTAIEHLCSHAGQYLNDGGWLVIEHGFDQQQRVADCFHANGFAAIETAEDLSGHTRMTAGKT